jgi:hypothetical protein
MMFEKSKTDIVIIDLDGCISDDKLRRHLILDGRRDWNEYYSRCDEDTPFPWALKMLPGLIDYYQIVFLTGRPEHVREKTNQWLSKVYNGLGYGCHDYQLYMRPEGDYTPAPIYKKKVVHHLREKGLSILFAFDDDTRILDMYKDEQITGLLPWTQKR